MRLRRGEGEAGTWTMWGGYVYLESTQASMIDVRVEGLEKKEAEGDES